MNSVTEIFNLDGQPFRSFAEAAAMRDLLVRETAFVRPRAPSRYRVEQCGALAEAADGGADDPAESGFMLIRFRDPHESAETRQTEGTDTDQPGPDAPVSPRVYHPALRVQVLVLPLLLAGLVPLLYTVECWRFVLAGFGLSAVPVWIDPQFLIVATRWAAGLVVLRLVAGILVYRYRSVLSLDERGIAYRQGLLARDITQIRFHEIRRIGLRQDALERLLNIGTLEFASSGTEGVDIRACHLADPAGVKAAIEGLIARQSGKGGAS